MEHQINKIITKHNVRIQSGPAESHYVIHTLVLFTSTVCVFVPCVYFARACVRVLILWVYSPEHIYLGSAEVIGFGSCVILSDLLLTYDESDCTSNLKKMNVDLSVQCHIFRLIDTSAAAPYDNAIASVSLRVALSYVIKAEGKMHTLDMCLQTEEENNVLMINEISYKTK